MSWLINGARNFYRQLGEVLGIGATCHLLRIAGKTILIDFGVALSRNGEFQIQGLPAGNFLIGTHIDLIIITHAHMDHMGAIARLIRHHPEAKVVVSTKALEAMWYMLADSLNIMKGEQLKASRFGLASVELLFDESDLDRFFKNPNMTVIDQSRCWLDPRHDLNNKWPGWEIGFCESGHDVGAKMTFMITPSGRPYLITGDVASQSQIFIKGVMLPDRKFLGDFFDRPGLIMITEATNGNKPMVESVEETVVKFGHLLQEAADKEAHALVCAFSKNRVTKTAVAAMDLGYVPFIDGSGRQMMRVELGEDQVEMLLKTEKMIFADGDKGIAKEQRRALLNGELGFHPIIAPSGTLEGGWSVNWAKDLLPGRNNKIIFPGYMFPESVSRQVYDMTRGRTIKLNLWDGKTQSLVATPVNVIADVHHINFSSHDFQGGLVERIDLAHPETLIIHHCDDGGFAGLETAAKNLPDAPSETHRASHMKEIELAA